MFKKLLVSSFMLLSLFLYGCTAYTKEKIYTLEQIKVTNSISGSFFLGCGSIDSIATYIFYTNENGAIKLRQVPYKNVIIFYTEETPKAHYKYEGNTSGYDFRDWNIEYIINLNYGVWYIYIPKNSIVNDYNVNIK